MTSKLHYACVLPCKRSFATLQGLGRHQASCKILKTDLEQGLVDVNASDHPLRTKRRKIDSDDVYSIAVFHSNTESRSTSRTGTSRSCETVACPTGSDPSQSLGRGKRIKRKPARYCDPLPVGPSNPPKAVLQQNKLRTVPVTDLFESLGIRTETNRLGLTRIYFSCPTFKPDEHVHPYSVSVSRPYQYPCSLGFGITAPSSHEHRNKAVVGDSPPMSNRTKEECDNLVPWYSPFPNPASFRMMKWFWTGTEKKSIADLQDLIKTVLLAPDFKLDDIATMNVRKENRRIDEHVNGLTKNSVGNVRPLPFDGKDGWREASVQIKLPDRVRHTSEGEAPSFVVCGLHYRPIMAVIKSAFESQAALRYHYTPFKQIWRPSENEPEQRIYDEMYSSDVWLNAHAQVLAQEAVDEYERAIAGIMLWSDSTQLAKFGSASLWPVYMYLGNQSKYERCRPTSRACHHIAYLPKLPDTITEAFRSVGLGKQPSKSALAHCKRDLMHAIMTTIFDVEDFKQAYEHGTPVQCADGVIRRIYPRILTYSADYPEKVLLSSILYMSNYPCPRCLVPLKQANELGYKLNTRATQTKRRVDTHSLQTSIEAARNFIYVDGRGVKCVAVEKMLGSLSLVPTKNAFSKLLFGFGVNFYDIFVVDIMHDFELGVWKMTFTHLMRILTASHPDAIGMLNERYRAIPTFGNGTIRKFTQNASTMKQLGARDFEDLLQCSMPVFEGLLPKPHNDIVLDLLFELCKWHALAKLRMHTHKTVTQLEDATRHLGDQLRKFKNVTCKAYETHELRSELDSRVRRQLRAAKSNKGGNSTGIIANDNPQSAEIKSLNLKSQPKRKHFNINTYKVHALAHYPEIIRSYGTTDSYSTQPAELEHRQVKRHYSRTNKNNPTAQMARIERRETALRAVAMNDPWSIRSKDTSRTRIEGNTCTRQLEKNQTDLRHHYISLSSNDYLYLPAWLREHDGDPALKCFQTGLKDHLLGRLLKKDFNGDEYDFEDADRNAVQIENHRLYIHNVLRVNHTTYDVRRNQDSVKAKTHCDVIVLAPKEEGEESDLHAYWYARVLGVYHANVRFTKTGSVNTAVPEKIEFLWVRWFGRALDIKSGWSARRLHIIGFVPENGSSPAFGFLDPSHIVRGVHLMPAFALGRTSSLLTASIARPQSDRGEDWRYYYVGSFVDRDIFMRYAGGGVGHAELDLSSLQYLESLGDSAEDRENHGVSAEQTLSAVCPDSEEHLDIARLPTFLDEDNDEVHSLCDSDVGEERAMVDRGGGEDSSDEEAFEDESDSEHPSDFEDDT